MSEATVHGRTVVKGTMANNDAGAHVQKVAGKVDGVKIMNTAALALASV